MLWETVCVGGRYCMPWQHEVRGQLAGSHHVGPKDGNQVVRVAEPSRQPTFYFHTRAWTGVLCMDNMCTATDIAPALLPYNQFSIINKNVDNNDNSSSKVLYYYYFFKYCIIYWISYEIPMSIRSYILEKTIFFRPSRISQNISLLLFFIIVMVNDYWWYNLQVNWQDEEQQVKRGAFIKSKELSKQGDYSRYELLFF